jgi:hypothetical protein
MEQAYSAIRQTAIAILKPCPSAPIGSLLVRGNSRTSPSWWVTFQPSFFFPAPNGSPGVPFSTVQDIPRTGFSVRARRVDIETPPPE